MFIKFLVLFCSFFSYCSGIRQNNIDLADLEEELLSADVFTQISSATSLGLLVSSQGDAMCGGKYRSCVSDELAEKLSRNLSVDLKHYIHYI